MRKVAKKIYRLAENFLFQNTSFHSLPKFSSSDKTLENRDLIEIVTVAFNNEQVIAQQIRLIKKYILDPYQYTIADNSSDPEKQNQIYRICKDHQVAYFRLPKNPMNGIDGSASQGLAQNWLYKNFISLRKANYFGFLDHDIFPICPIRLMDLLKNQKVYGHIQRREKKWYLWAGFCFFDRTYIELKKINFMPGNGMDTGSMNWDTLYKDLDLSLLAIPEHEYGALRAGTCPQSDWYEKIGGWIHTFNASEWFSAPPKMGLVNQLLEQY